MTDDEIIIEVAKLDGWTFGDRVTDKKTGISWDVYRKGEQHGSIYVGTLPKYLTSRDAIMPVIEKQENHVKVDLVHQLDDGLFNNWQPSQVVAVLLSTPRQLCIALLKATGKWRE
jgi:hypothetical protein